MKLIVAVDKNWGIGKSNGLLFSIPEDMQFFRKTTTSKVVCMGYNTLLSFPGSKPLKNRVNVVLWPDGERDDVIIAKSLDDLSAKLKEYDTDETFIVGGAMFYKTMLDYCSEVIVTKVDADGGATVFFENLDERDGWKLDSETDFMTAENGLRYKFCNYVNAKVKQF